MEQSAQTLPDIRHTLVFNASIQKVWDAVSTAEGMAEWFMPNNMQPVVGSTFELNAGPYGMSPCKVIEVSPPNRLSFNWGKDWTLTFELHELDGKTEFTLIHSGWDPNTVTEFGQPHAVVRGIMDTGWAGMVQKLGRVVEG